jgi:hypothetical protein
MQHGSGRPGSRSSNISGIRIRNRKSEQEKKRNKKNFSERVIDKH